MVEELNQAHKDILDNVKNNKKGFELLKSVKMPKQNNNPERKIKTLSEIWYGYEINKVREKHLKNKGEDINICKNCSFKDVYKWI